LLRRMDHSAPLEGYSLIYRSDRRRVSDVKRGGKVAGSRKYQAWLIDQRRRNFVAVEKSSPHNRARRSILEDMQKVEDVSRAHLLDCLFQSL